MEQQLLVREDMALREPGLPLASAPVALGLSVCESETLPLSELTWRCYHY